MTIDLNFIAFWQRKFRQVLDTLLQLRSWLLFLMIPALFFGERLYHRSLVISPLRLEDIPELPLEAVRRLLVIAPHPDDETLGAGGVIQAVLAYGAQVKVVMMTNGDGQIMAPLLLHRQIRPRAVNYIAAGEHRQIETLAALQLLGLPQEAILFMGYPDRGLTSLWESNWNGACPVKAPYTRSTRSPYALTFNPQASYCGRDLLADLGAIINDYKPDLVLLPHPSDDHADHRAAANFSLLALALSQAAEPDYQPAIWGYLIHYDYYPQPRGLQPDRSLLPPAALVGDSGRWARFNLSPAQLELKTQAIQAYPTQRFLLGSFLPSFIRQNELFAHIPAVTSPESLSFREAAKTN